MGGCRTQLTILLIVIAGLAAAGENPALIPPAELQALDRAIAREANSGSLGSQTLGDLYRLKTRLQRLQQSAKTEAELALAPLDGDDSQRRQLDRLEREAVSGGRAARRSLALYYLFLNEPEKALAQWRQMGRANEYDLQYMLISSYLEFALGEYGTGRKNLETALRLMESRSSLAVSPPIFCQNIGGYRIFTARQPGNLLPGENVLLYVEVEGAEFVNTPDGSECRLLFGLKLVNDAQGTVWAEPNYGEYAPYFAGPIRDLHAALTWRVPNDLEPGRYHLTVEAVEDSTKRRGEGAVGFTVGKRETNPEKRPTGTLTPGMQRQIQEAQKTFSGGGAAEGNSPWGGSREDTHFNDRYFQDRQFDLLQQHLKEQRVQ